MKCPFCASLENKVIDSRLAAGGEVTRRRRECEGCNRRYTTYERVEEALPLVVKKDDRREPFDRSKVMQGIRRACEKRPVSADRIEALVDEIERELQAMDVREVPTSAVGERVMLKLRELDQVAYVRFASVYRQFGDISEFVEELSRLMTKGRASAAQQPSSPPSATRIEIAPGRGGARSE